MKEEPSLGFAIQCLKVWSITLLVLIALCALSCAQPLQDATASATNSTAVEEQWVWCVEDDDEKPICDKMTQVLSQIDSEQQLTHSCIISDGGAEGCMEAVNDGRARFAVFDGGEILTANQQYGLVPIRTEDSDFEENMYWGVGVVKADKCPKSLDHLKGKVSCHTGYGRSAGWVLPLTYFIQNNIMPVVSKDPNVRNDIESVENFFSKSCAANNKPNIEICSACKKTVECNMDDLYYDYAGAFRCLVEGSGDVAFTKHDIPVLYAKGGLLAADWNNLGYSSGYKILCPGADTLCQDISNYKECNFGSAPGHTIMVGSDFPKLDIQKFNALMDKAIASSTYTSIFGNETVANEFAAGVSRSIVYNAAMRMPTPSPLILS
eukprot:Gb_31201 [translate_table: standard]